MEAELHSYPKEHHQGGNACQRIHPLCLLSTSTYDLKEGLDSGAGIEYTSSFQHTDVLHIETNRQGRMIFDSDTMLAGLTSTSLMIELVHIWSIRQPLDIELKLRMFSRAEFQGEELVQSSRECRMGWEEPAQACRSPSPEETMMKIASAFHHCQLSKPLKVKNHDEIGCA